MSYDCRSCGQTADLCCEDAAEKFREYEEIIAILKPTGSETTLEKLQRLIIDNQTMRTEIDAIPPLNEAKHDAIVKAMKHARGNITGAARILRIDRKTLYRWLNRCGGKTAIFPRPDPAKPATR